MPRLTVQVRQGEAPANGVEVVLQLAAPDQLVSGEQVSNDPIIQHTNLAGEAEFDVPASSQFIGQSLYTVRVARSRPITFAMPATSRTLSQILASAAPTDPGNTPSAGTFAQPTAPTAPQPGTIWFDTSVDPADGRWYDGTAWQEIRDPADIAAALNSLTGTDRVDGRHIQNQVKIPIFTTLPPVTDYEPGERVAVQAAGQTSAVAYYFLSRADSTTLTDRNRLQVTIANNVVASSQDNYRNFLGSVLYDTTHRRLTLRLDTGITQVPDQLWIRGLEVSALTAFQVDPFQPYSYSGGRRYKQLRGTLSQARAQAGINRAWTWLLFSDIGGTEEYDFKPATEALGSEWVQVTGSGGGGGLTEGQVDARVAAGVEDWAETSNTDTIPSAKLASGGTSGQVLKRTSTGQEWAADAGGLDQAQVDARVVAGTKGFAQAGNTAKVDTGDIEDDAIEADQLAAGAVGGAAIADGGVAAGKYAEDSIDQDDLAASLVSQLVPGGGSQGQVLKKASNTPYDTEWAADAGGLSQAQVDARVAERVPDGGTQNQVLQKASATDGDTEWGDKATAGVNLTEVQSYRTYANATSSSSSTSAPLTLPSGFATGNAALLVVGAMSATNVGTSTIPMAVLSAATGASTTVGNLSISGLGAAHLRFNATTRNLTIVGFSGGQRPRILYAALVGSAAEEGAGLNQSQVDGRVRALVANFAEQGNTDLIPVAKLASGGTTGQVLKRTATGQEWAADAGGLDQAAVDARVAAGVADFAETGNTDTLPSAKLASGGSTGQVLKRTSTGQEWAADNEGLTQAQVDARVQAGVADFAEQGNTDLIPQGKLASGGSVGQVLKRTASGQEWAADAGGLSQAQVDARVQAGVADFAEQGNTDTLPSAKLAAGGTDGQILTRTATGQDWEDAPSAASAGNLVVTPVQSTVTATLADTGTSWRAAGAEAQLTLAAGTLATAQAVSVSNNQIVVAAGTSPYQGTIQASIIVVPTAWTGAVTSGGSRLFYDVVLKKDGVDLPTSVASSYVRARSGWFGDNWHSFITFTGIISPGNYTLHLRRKSAAGGGVEINNIRVDSSTIQLNSQTFTGATVVGGIAAADVEDFAKTAQTGARVPTSKGGVLTGGAAGQVYKRTASGYEWAADEQGSGGGGLTQSQVDARIQAFARTGNTDLIPQSKLAAGGSVGQVLKRTASGQEWANDNEGLSQSQVDARVQAGVADFAEQGNTDLIPQSKLASGGSVGQVLKRTASGQEWAADNAGLTQAQVDARVQAGVADWAEQGNASRLPDSKLSNTVQNRLVPSGGTTGQILAKASNSAYDDEWVNAPSAGLSQAQVDARILAFARTGNTDLIPQSKLAAGGSVGQVLKRTSSGQEWANDEGLTQAQVDARVATWARQGNTTRLPDSKLSNTTQNRLIPSGGTTGQVLAKRSNSAYDDHWINAPGGVVTAVQAFTTSPTAGTTSFSPYINLPTDYATYDLLVVIAGFSNNRTTLTADIDIFRFLTVGEITYARIPLGTTIQLFLRLGITGSTRRVRVQSSRSQDRPSINSLKLIRF